MFRTLLLFFLCFPFTLYAQSSAALEVREKNASRLMGVWDNQSVASPNYNVHFYRCDWNIDPAVRYISGNVTSYFTITEATTSISFDLFHGLTIDSILYHGTKTTFQQTANDALQINFPVSVAAGQSDSLSIFYQGVPAGTGFGSFVQTTHSSTPVIWTLSEPYGAHDWWPCKDVLIDKADSIDISITYPAAYQSSSNGVLINEQMTGDKKRDHWKHRYPIASYLVAIAVTNYAIDRDSVQLPSRMMPVEMYAYPEYASVFKAATATAKGALQMYSSLLGEYPFSTERYAQTEFGWGGGMEHQTNSFIVAPNTNLVAHELAHQWFGDAVTCGSWQDIWLNEGFATYMAFVYTKDAALLQNWNNSITALPGGSVFVPDTTNEGRIFDGRLSYNKGAYVLHMLRWKLGDSLFFRGLRHYLNDPAVRFSTARTADLQRNLEEVSGQLLTEFFKDWVYGEGYPTYKAEWNLNRTKSVQVVLSQTTSHASVPFYEMPVPLEFKNATRDTIVTVNHTHSGEVFTLNLGFVPDTLIIDPQRWILSKNNVAVRTADAFEPTDVLIYPNPAVNNVTVYLPAMATQNISLRLFTVLGQQLFSKTITTSGNQEVMIPLYSFAPGMYWVQVLANNNNRMIKRLVVLKH